MVVPEAIAYAGLAGVPPLSGVWAVVFVLPFYVIFGSSRHLVATPTSAASVTAGGIIVGLGLTSPDQAVVGLAAITLCAGILFFLMWLWRLGFFVNFISKPVNSGFMFGLAIFIVISQIPKVLGVPGGSGSAIERIVSLAKVIGQTNWTTVGLGAVAMACMIGLPYLSKKLPGGLIALVVCTVLVSVFSLDETADVATVGALPTGWPSLVIPRFGFSDWIFIVVGAAGLVMLAFSEASSVARSQAEASGRKYDPERDLFAFGIGNMVSGLFGGLTGAGSMSSTSANVAAGAKTQLSTAVTAVAALLTALFFGSIIGNLPEVALGALIIHAIAPHLKVNFVKRIGAYSPLELRISLLAAAGVLVLDVLYGLLLAMVVSLGWYIYLTTSIRTVRLGKSKTGPPALVAEDAPNYSPFNNGNIGIRFDSTMFYGNINSALDPIEDAAKEQQRSNPGHKPVLLIDFGSQWLLDYTSAGKLHQLCENLSEKVDQIVLVATSMRLFDSLARYAPLPDHVEAVIASQASIAIDLVDPDPDSDPDPGKVIPGEAGAGGEIEQKV